ncbi:hypothetical protein C8R46DRAFT_1117319 [Mycena filopes]|nr:hypothetical protein C8R46DRAFT_1117319 [Mycena filopes]
MTWKWVSLALSGRSCSLILVDLPQTRFWLTRHGCFPSQRKTEKCSLDRVHQPFNASRYFCLSAASMFKPRPRKDPSIHQSLHWYSTIQAIRRNGVPSMRNRLLR